MSKTIKMLLNLGWQDALQIGVDETKFTEGTVHTLEDEKADFLVKRLRCAEEPRAGEAAAGTPDDSPVIEDYAKDAIAEIHAMTKRDRAKLEHIRDNDPRKTVVEAATQKLVELG